MDGGGPARRARFRHLPGGGAAACGRPQLRRRPRASDCVRGARRLRRRAGRTRLRLRSRRRRARAPVRAEHCLRARREGDPDRLPPVPHHGLRRCSGRPLAGRLSDERRRAGQRVHPYGPRRRLDVPPVLVLLPGLEQHLGRIGQGVEGGHRSSQPRSQDLGQAPEGAALPRLPSRRLGGLSSRAQPGWRGSRARHRAPRLPVLQAAPVR